MERPGFLPSYFEREGVDPAPLCTTGLSLFCLWGWSVDSEVREKRALGHRWGVASCLQGSPCQASACLLLKMTPIQMAEAKPRRKSWHHQRRASARPGRSCVLEKESLVCVGNGTGSGDDSQHLAWPHQPWPLWQAGGQARICLGQSNQGLFLMEMAINPDCSLPTDPSVYQWGTLHGIAGKVWPANHPPWQQAVTCLAAHVTSLVGKSLSRAACVFYLYPKKILFDWQIRCENASFLSTCTKVLRNGSVCVKHSFKELVLN